MLLKETGRISMWLLSILVAVLLLPQGSGFETGLSFSGSLERVGDRSISVKLADRSVIDAMLPPDTSNLQASALSDQYQWGDEVEISCKPIPPVWEEATSRYQSLEVTAMRLARRPSEEEAAKWLEARSREGKNLLERPRGDFAAPQAATEALASSPGGAGWEHARKVNLEYLANMPNFVADEETKRFRSGTKSGRMLAYDTIAAEITFRGRNAIRQQIRRNGKPWDQPFEALPGYKWYEGFETEISPLFDAHCPTTIEYQGRSKAGGRRLIEYRFRSPVDGCFPFFYFTYERYNPARTGRVFIDDPGGNVIQVDDETDGFPPGFEFAKREEHVFWDYVKIGESSHLLPVRANFLAVYSTGTRYRIEIEYKNHRHFESSTNVSFQ